MTSIYTFVEYIQEPAFLVDTDLDRVVFVNKAASSSLPNILNGPYSSVFIPIQSLLSDKLYSYSNKLYTLHDTCILVSDKPYKIIVVHEQKESTQLLDIAEELAGLLVHIFRSPLSGILGFTDLMKNQIDESQQRYASSIEGGLLKITRILDEVEELANISDPHIASFKPEALLVDLLLDFPQEKQERIEVNITERGTSIDSDYVLARAILNELLANALQFGNDTDQHIQMHYKGQGIFTITNFGNTIPEEDIAKIFYPFFSSKGSNTGLGLTKASMYAHAINASLILSSNSEKEGVCFELRI